VETGEDESFAIVITDYADGFQADVETLLALLGIEYDLGFTGDIVMPVSLAVHGRDDGAIGITTRSVLRLVEIFSAAVEVPEGDIHRAQTYPPLGPMVEGLRIRQARREPENASLAVRFREGWYYIPDDDRISKGYFRLLTVLWSVVISEGSAGASGAPLLTVPVSG
jgi:hypothetical protein